MHDRAAFALLALPFLGFLFYALEYDIEDVHYYFIPTYLARSYQVTAVRGRGAATSLPDRPTVR